MKVRTIQIIGLVGVMSVAVGGALALAAANASEVGRSDPKRAANYRPPLFNFSETYTDGVALGVAVGSTKVDAIKAAERAGFAVQPSCWGDSRAGGAELYERSELKVTMLRQSYLCFHSPDDLNGGMIVNFGGDKVAAVEVYYINFEAI